MTLDVSSLRMINVTDYIQRSSLEYRPSHTYNSMFLAQNTVLHFWAFLLKDTRQERDHLPLTGVFLIGLALLVFLLVHRKGLLNAFESFEKLTHTVRYRILGEFILGLSSTWAHTNDVTCKVLVIKRSQFGGLRTVIEAG